MIDAKATSMRAASVIYMANGALFRGFFVGKSVAASLSLTERRNGVIRRGFESVREAASLGFARCGRGRIRDGLDGVRWGGPNVCLVAVPFKALSTSPLVGAAVLNHWSGVSSPESDVACRFILDFRAVSVQQRSCPSVWVASVRPCIWLEKI
jgi:hypothetical protein